MWSKATRRRFACMNAIEPNLCKVLRQKFSLMPIKTGPTDRIRIKNAELNDEILVFNLNICVGGIGQYPGEYSAETVNIGISDVWVR